MAEVSLNNVVLNGHWLDATLTGSEFSGSAGGISYSGTDFAGAYFNGLSDNGSQISLRIESVTQDAPPDDDIWSYDVSYLDESTSTWKPLCVDGSGNTVNAIAVSGYWNYDQGADGGGSKTDSTTEFTFACRGLGAIAKCITPIGYAPWRTYNGVSLEPYHQACTRMIRADYCGNGTSYTHDGNWVNVYDALGLEVDTENWGFEAEWDEGGARCFTDHLRAQVSVPCYDSTKAATCGDLSHFDGGTLVMDEIP